MGAVGVFTLVFATSVVSLMILFSFSNAWQCLDGSIAFHLFSLTILMRSSSAIQYNPMFGSLEWCITLEGM